MSRIPLINRLPLSYPRKSSSFAPDTTLSSTENQPLNSIASATSKMASDKTSQNESTISASTPQNATPGDIGLPKVEHVDGNDLKRFLVSGERNHSSFESSTSQMNQSAENIQSGPIVSTLLENSKNEKPIPESESASQAYNIQRYWEFETVPIRLALASKKTENQPVSNLDAAELEDQLKCLGITENSTNDQEFKSIQEHASLAPTINDRPIESQVPQLLPPNSSFEGEKAWERFYYKNNGRDQFGFYTVHPLFEWEQTAEEAIAEHDKNLKQTGSSLRRGCDVGPVIKMLSEWYSRQPEQNDYDPDGFLPALVEGMPTTITRANVWKFHHRRRAILTRQGDGWSSMNLPRYTDTDYELTWSLILGVAQISRDACEVMERLENSLLVRSHIKTLVDTCFSWDSKIRSALFSRQFPIRKVANALIRELHEKFSMELFEMGRLSLHWQNDESIEKSREVWRVLQNLATTEEVYQRPYLVLRHNMIVESWRRISKLPVFEFSSDRYDSHKEISNLVSLWPHPTDFQSDTRIDPPKEYTNATSTQKEEFRSNLAKIWQNITMTKLDQALEIIDAVFESDTGITPVYRMEDGKQLLVIKAYILALEKKWEDSIALQMLLYSSPPESWPTDHGYRALLHLAQAITSYYYNKAYDAAEISCFKSLQYQEMPEHCEDQRSQVYFILARCLERKDSQGAKEATEYWSRIQNHEETCKQLYGKWGILLERRGILVRRGVLQTDFTKSKDAMRDSEMDLTVFDALFADDLSWIRELVDTDFWQGYPIIYYGVRDNIDVLQKIKHVPEVWKVVKSSIDIGMEAFARSLLACAVRSVRFLVTEIDGIDVNKLYPTSMTVDMGNFTLLHSLMGRRDPISSLSSGYNIPLYEDVRDDVREEIFKVLEELDVDVNILDGEGRSPLDCLKIVSDKHSSTTISARADTMYVDKYVRVAKKISRCKEWLIGMGAQPGSKDTQIRSGPRIN